MYKIYYSGWLCFKSEVYVVLVFLILLTFCTYSDIIVESLNHAWLFWNPKFPGKNAGMSCHFLLQGIFPIQGWSPGLPHCRKTLPSEPPGGSVVKHPSASAGARGDAGLIPQSKIPWRRKWQFFSVFLHKECHEQEEPGRLHSMRLQSLTWLRNWAYTWRYNRCTSQQNQIMCWC